MGNKTYRKLTPEALMEIAGQYKTRREFYEGDPSAFVSASRRKINVPVLKKDGSEYKPPRTQEVRLLDHVCAHMYTGRFKWTKSMILNAAKSYQTRTDFAKGNKSAYTAARRRGLLAEACAHMPRCVSKKQREAENV